MCQLGNDLLLQGIGRPGSCFLLRNAERPGSCLLLRSAGTPCSCLLLQGISRSRCRLLLRNAERPGSRLLLRRAGAPGRRRKLILQGSSPDGHELLVLFRRDRSGKIIPLDQVAPHRPQGIQLVLCLHTLRDHGHREVVRDLDDDLQHAGILALVKGVADKLHVELEGIDRQGRDHIQGRVPCPEIIHLDPEAQAPQAVDCVNDLLGILGIGGLCDLQKELSRRQAVFLQDLLEGLHEVGVIHIDPRDVYGDRHRDAEPFPPVPDLRGGLRPDILVQPLDQPVLLKEGDENAGGDHAQGRMEPAHQGFRARQHGDLRAHVKLGLIKNFKLVFFDRRIKILDQALGVEFPLMEHAVIDADRFCKAAPNSVRSHFCAVKAALDIEILVHILVDSHAEPDAVIGRDVPRQSRRGALQNHLPVPAMGTVDHEGVRLPAADDPAVFLHHLAHLLADPAQDTIPVDRAEALVDHVEMVDVHDDGVHLRLLVVMVKLLGIAVEIFAVVKPCQGVPFCGIDDLSVLREFDRAEDTRQHDACLGIGLGYEIDRAQRQALDLRILIGGQDNDRDHRQFRLLPHPPQDFQSAHDRHLQIHQNEGELFTRLPHFFQRFPAVLCIDHFIIVLQDQAQQFPVDQFVICDQNQTFSVGGVEFFMALEHGCSFRIFFQISGPHEAVSSQLLFCNKRSADRLLRPGTYSCDPPCLLL